MQRSTNTHTSRDYINTQILMKTDAKTRKHTCTQTYKTNRHTDKKADRAIDK